MERESNHGRGSTQASSLYVVATPIGNLADITLRALEILKTVDAVAAEDTRVTAKLFAHYGITTPLIALHEHNERRAARRIIDLLAAGKSVALVSDAGTPAISDPGAQAIAAVREAGHRIVPIPGANAAVCAVSAAGTTAPFLFYGFLPAQSGARRKALEPLKVLPYPIIFYEAPHRVLASIADMEAAFGTPRRVTIARELTKLFETIHTCSLGDAPAWLTADPHRLKGEFAILVDGAATDTAAADPALTAVLRPLLREVTLKQAVKLASEITGARKNEIYQLALTLKGATDGDRELA